MAITTTGKAGEATEKAQRTEKDTTAARVVASAYESVVALGDSSSDLREEAARMRFEFQRRTGPFGPEDPWFEPRARAFWDDALTTQRFASLEKTEPHLSIEARVMEASFRQAHRGFFVVVDVDDREAVLLDMWSGAELIIQHLDETQTLTLEHAEGGIDGRVCRSPSDSTSSASSAALFLLPGAYHHPADGLDPAIDVLHAARERGMKTQPALDALMRMEHVFRSSSRVKAGFAYRVESLGRIQAEEEALRA